MRWALILVALAAQSVALAGDKITGTAGMDLGDKIVPYLVTVGERQAKMARISRTVEGYSGADKSLQYFQLDPPDPVGFFEGSRVSYYGLRDSDWRLTEILVEVPGGCDAPGEPDALMGELRKQYEVVEASDESQVPRETYTDGSATLMIRCSASMLAMRYTSPLFAQHVESLKR